MHTPLVFIFLLLLSSGVDAQDWQEFGGGSWRPEQEMLNDALEPLRASFSSAVELRSELIPPWGTHKLWYFGIEQNGIRLIQIIGNCVREDDGGSDLEEIIVLADGGPCNFSALYDPVTKSIVDFLFNGYA